MSGGSLGATAFAFWKTFEISVPTALEALVGRLTPEACDARLQLWSQAVLERAGIVLEIHGRDRVPLDGPCVYMSNHQSHFDVPVCYAACPGRLRMVAKAELFRWPVFGPAMRAAGMVPVDRSGNRARVRQAMRQAAAAVASGVRIWIAPEGTRSKDGRIGPFKKGGFLLARETGASIVPMAIDGTIAVVPKHATLVRPGARVRVTFGEPIAVRGRELPAVMDEVRAFITGQLPPFSGDV